VLMKLQSLVIIIGLLALPYNYTWSASFDCQKAQTSVEKSICGDKELSDLDSSVAIAYHKLLKVSKDKSAVIASQREWLKTRSTSPYPTFLISKYKARLDILNKEYDKIVSESNIPPFPNNHTITNTAPIEDSNIPPVNDIAKTSKNQISQASEITENDTVNSKYVKLINSLHPSSDNAYMSKPLLEPNGEWYVWHMKLTNQDNDDGSLISYIPETVHTIPSRTWVGMQSHSTSWEMTIPASGCFIPKNDRDDLKGIIYIDKEIQLNSDIIVIGQYESNSQLDLNDGSKVTVPVLSNTYIFNASSINSK